MKTKFVVAALVAVLVATATLATAASYKSKIVNNSGVTVSVQLDILPGVIQILAHTVKDLLYTVATVVGAVLKLTMTITAVVDGVVEKVVLDIVPGATITITEVLDVLVNGALVGSLA